MGNDPSYHTSSLRIYPQRYPHQDFYGQFIYYEDEDGNNYPSSPGEISF